jgi:hypothetical protein
MRPRYLILLLAALPLAAPAPVSAGDAPKAKAYKTPEEAYKAIAKANKEGDWKTFCDSLTPQSRDLFAGLWVMLGGDFEKEMNASLEKEKDEEKRAFLKTIMDQLLKPVREAYEKHGVTAK